MKEFLSNAWVVSILSGILVFFITNSAIMLQNGRKHKKQINNANAMVLNRLRSYVVDNGLPPKEIINAIKASTAREFNIKYDELLNIKELCEELITDIIGNIYISNDNKVKYIEMLKNYLKEKGNLQEDMRKNKQIENRNRRKRNKINNYIELAFSIFSAIVAFVSMFKLSLLSETKVGLDKTPDIFLTIAEPVSIIGLFVLLILILPEIRSAIKWLKEKI